MGPTSNEIEQIKLEATRNTLRHFRNAVEDQDWEPRRPLADVRKELLGNEPEFDADEVGAETEDTKPSRGRKAKASADTESEPETEGGE